MHDIEIEVYHPSLELITLLGSFVSSLDDDELCGSLENSERNIILSDHQSSLAFRHEPVLMNS